MNEWTGGNGPLCLTWLLLAWAAVNIKMAAKCKLTGRRRPTNRRRTRTHTRTPTWELIWRGGDSAWRARQSSTNSHSEANIELLSSPPNYLPPNKRINFQNLISYSPSPEWNGNANSDSIKRADRSPSPKLEYFCMNEWRCGDIGNLIQQPTNQPAIIYSDSAKAVAICSLVERIVNYNPSNLYFRNERTNERMDEWTKESCKNSCWLAIQILENLD